MFSCFPSRVGSATNDNENYLVWVLGKPFHRGWLTCNDSIPSSVCATRRCWGDFEGGFYVLRMVQQKHAGNNKIYDELPCPDFTLWTRRINLYSVEATAIWGWGKQHPNPSLWDQGRKHDYKIISEHKSWSVDNITGRCEGEEMGWGVRWPWDGRGMGQASAFRGGTFQAEGM